MRKILFLFLLPVLLTASENTLGSDSLKRLFYTSDEYLYISKLKTEIDSLSTVNPQMALQKAQNLYAFALACGSQSEATVSATYLGQCYLRVGDIYRALTSFLEALSIAKKMNDAYGVGEISSKIGKVYQETGDYEIAIRYYLESLKALELTGTSLILCNIYTDLGKTYYSLGNEVLAENYYDLALKKAKYINNAGERALIVNIIAKHYMEVLRFSDAISLNRQALNTCPNKKKYAHIIAEIYNDLGLCYRQLNNFDLALEYNLCALQKREGLNNDDLIACSYYNLAELYTYNDMFKQALFYLDKSSALFAERKTMLSTRMLRDSYRLYSLIYEKTNNLVQALTYSKKYNASELAYFKLISDERIRQVELKSELKSKKIENEILQKSNSEITKTANYLLNFMLFIFFVNLSVGIFTIYVIVRLRKKEDENTLLNKQLEEKIHELKAVLAEKTKSEEALKESEEKYKAVVNQSADCIYIIDLKSGEILETNPYFLNIFNYTKEDTKGLTIFDLVNKSRESLLSFIKKVVEERSCYVGEGEYRCADGNLISVESTSAIINFHGREAICIIARDIRERKKYEQELIKAKEIAEYANTAKTQFLANISHEIRTPLNAVLGFSELILQNEISPTMREYVELIKSSSDHLLVIINDLLHIAKLESGKFSLESEKFDLKEVLEKVHRNFEPILQEKGLAFEMTYDSAICYRVVGDKVRIKQILFNLLSNAQKFTTNGKITLKSELKKTLAGNGQLVSFCVEDTGIGIPPGKLEKIFDQFYQVDNFLNKSHAGTGLGLSICRQLAEAMGGKIFVFSQFGCGSVFTVELPLPKDMDTDEIAPPLNDCVPPKNPIRILLAEDNSINQKIMLAFAKKCAWKIELAENGLEVLERLKQTEFDLILMDIQMPKMDGIEATKVIREDLGLSLPIVALTAHMPADEEETFLNQGFDYFVPKPINFNELVNIIETIRSKK